MLLVPTLLSCPSGCSTHKAHLSHSVCVQGGCVKGGLRHLLRIRAGGYKDEPLGRVAVNTSLQRGQSTVRAEGREEHTSSAHGTRQLPRASPR